MSSVDLRTDIGGLVISNPVLTASGTFGFGTEYAAFGDPAKLGAVVVNAVTLGPTEGNKPQRIVETAAGMLNSIGLENPGSEYFINHHLPKLTELGVTTIVNIAANSVDEYCLLAERMNHPEVAALELNISCPNVAAGGMAFGVSEEAVHEVVSKVRQQTALPLIVKLTPNVTDIAAIAKVAEAAGADAISLINTLLGMAIDARTRRPILGNVVGGLSGPAIKPVALRMVWQVARAVTVPVIGVGGIMTAEDAVEFLIAGASAVQIGVASFVEPRSAWQVIDGIAAYLEEHGFSSVSELVGSLQL